MLRMTIRKTKIICTIGPASNSPGTLQQLIDSGMNIARLNFSHGTHEEHLEVMKRIRKISDKVGIMMDTQGPEVRLGEVEDDTVLINDTDVRLVSDDIVGDRGRLSVDYPEMFEKLEKGDTVLLADGDVELKVVETGEEVLCRVIYGGPISSKKSINVPGKDIGLTAPTEKDVRDIHYAAENGFDFISASFIKSGEDVKKIKDLLKQKNANMHVISKIEHMKAVENLDEVLEISDGIMIARGDLGVEVPASEVPLLQKEIIEKCNREEKPVIVATQMLKSMAESPRATRAEVSDVANAVRDGSDAVMLSEETAIGKYPVKSVLFMSEVVQKMENFLIGDVRPTVKYKSRDVADIIAKNVWQASRDIDARYIVVHTSSGYTAHKIAKYRPDTDIIAFTDFKNVQRRLSLVWGVTPYYIEFPEHVDEMVCATGEYLYKKGIADKEDKLIITAGVPQPVKGITNMMEIRTVESLLEEKEGL